MSDSPAQRAAREIVRRVASVSGAQYTEGTLIMNEHELASIIEAEYAALDPDHHYNQGWNDAVEQCDKIAKGWDFGGPIAVEIRALKVEEGK